MREGWVCQKCGRVWSPAAVQCGFCNNVVICSPDWSINQEFFDKTEKLIENKEIKKESLFIKNCRNCIHGKVKNEPWCLTQPHPCTNCKRFNTLVDNYIPI